LPAVGKIQPSALLEVGGRVYPLLFSFDALAEAERLSGCDLLLHHPATFYGTLTASQWRGLLASALLSESLPAAGCSRIPGPRDLLEVAGLLLRPESMRLVSEAIARAWVLSMPERKPEDRKDRNAPKQKLTSREIWERSWSAARVRLGLSDEQFGRMTPRQLRMLLDESGDLMEERRLLFGIVAAAVVNFSAHPPDKAVEPGDFFSSRRGKKQRERVAPSNVAGMRAFLMSQVTRTEKRTDEKAKDESYS
jgi:hypothetical protein